MVDSVHPSVIHQNQTVHSQKSNFDWKSVALTCATTVAVAAVAVLIYQSYSFTPSGDTESRIVELNQRIKQLQEAPKSQGNHTQYIPSSSEPGAFMTLFKPLIIVGTIFVYLTQNGVLPGRTPRIAV